MSARTEIPKEIGDNIDTLLITLVDKPATTH